MPTNFSIILKTDLESCIYGLSKVKLGIKQALLQYLYIFIEILFYLFYFIFHFLKIEL